MYKTVWIIFNETENVKSKFTYYHFGKEPKFPDWYCEEGRVYVIEMLWNVRLVPTIKIFYKCLFHQYDIE